MQILFALFIFKNSSFRKKTFLSFLCKITLICIYIKGGKLKKNENDNRYNVSGIKYENGAFLSAQYYGNSVKYG